VGKYLAIRYDGRTDMIPAELRDQGSLDLGVGHLVSRNGLASHGRNGEATVPVAVAAPLSGAYNGEVCPQCLQGTVRVTGTCRYCDTCQDSLGGCG
jgi:hypothetical protein